MKKQQVVLLIGIIALIIIVALVSSGKIQLSPAFSASNISKCQLGPLTNCINGCWQTYNDRIDDIIDASDNHRMNCCTMESHGLCEWDTNRSVCMNVNAKNRSDFCSEPDYWACVDTFDVDSLIEQAKKDRDACIKDCQNQFCSGGATNQQVQLSPAQTDSAKNILSARPISCNYGVCGTAGGACDKGYHCASRLAASCPDQKVYECVKDGSSNQ